MNDQYYLYENECFFMNMLKISLSLFLSLSLYCSSDLKKLKKRFSAPIFVKLPFRVSKINAINHQQKTTTKENIYIHKTSTLYTQHAYYPSLSLSFDHHRPHTHHTSSNKMKKMLSQHHNNITVLLYRIPSSNCRQVHH